MYHRYTSFRLQLVQCLLISSNSSPILHNKQNTAMANEDSEIIYRPQQELLIYKKGDVEMKYRVFQIYGQKYVKLMDADCCPPENMTEIYATNIPRTINIDKLFKFFVKCGEIYQLRLLMDFSGCNRGRCFVKYKNVMASRRAICCLHEEVLENDHSVEIKLSLNNNQLILKSIPAWIPEQQVVRFVKEYMGEGLYNVTIRPSRIFNKNYCFCTYCDHQFAIMAHKKAWPFVNINGSVVDVHWAVPELLRRGANLYFTNFPIDLTKEEFFNILIRKVCVNCIVQFRISNFYGFITFTNVRTVYDAEVALRGLVIRGVPLRFSTMPFTNNGDLLSFQYYNERINPVPFPEGVPSYPYPFLQTVGYRQVSPYQMNRSVYSQFHPYPVSHYFQYRHNTLGAYQMSLLNYYSTLQNYQEAYQMSLRNYGYFNQFYLLHCTCIPQ